jgi:Uma2 family endonuclease
MTTFLREGALPWTEEDYFALGESNERIELFDGSLYVSPTPTPKHQEISFHLKAALLPSARKVGLKVFGAVNVRLQTGRIPIPDLVITSPVDLDEPVIDCADVRLVCEIISPGNPAADRVLKMHYYAAAGIEWYLLADPDGPTLRLYHLEGQRYLEHAVAAPGTPLELTAPVKASIDPADLLG